MAENHLIARYGALTLGWRRHAVLRRNPMMPMGRKWLAATYVRLGRQDDAAWEVEETLMIMPDFSVSREARTMPIRDPELQRHLGGLRQAGFPE